MEEKNIINQPDLDVMREYLDKIEKQTEDTSLVEGLLTIMTMPDAEFNTLVPLVLNNLEEETAKNEYKTNMYQAFKEAGIDLKDIKQEFVQFLDNMDNELSEFPQSRRDFLKQSISLIYNMVIEGLDEADNTLHIPFELCHPNAKMPTYANPADAGMDVYALEDVTIHPGETVLVKTGLKCAIPRGYELQVRPKSGLSLKTKMRISNSPGTIDSGYRDEIGIIIDNIEPPIKDITYEADLIDGKPVITITSILHGNDMHIAEGQKFAQLVLSKVEKAMPYQIESVLSIENDGRSGGFGSTDVK